MTTDPAFRNNAARQRFELEVDGMTVFGDYERHPGTLVIRYVYAPPVLRGTGAAGRLMQGIVETAAAEGSSILATCSYADAWLRRHRIRADPAPRTVG